MASNKTIARIIGALIIIGYATYGIPDGAILQPLLDTPDALLNVAAQPMQLITGALIMSINSVAVVGIAVLLFPILKQHSEPVALGYFAARVFESVVMIVGVISLLLLVPLSQEFVQSDPADSSSFQALSTLAVQGNSFAYQIAMIGLSIGSLPFCYLLYQTKLIPRFISIMGLVGYPALLTSAVLGIFSFNTDLILYLYIPGGLFEIGFALWLIIKGFNSPEVAFGPAKPIPALKAD